jgi:hypothetical protein
MGSRREIEDWLRNQDDLCFQKGITNKGVPIWSAVSNNDTAHVQQLVKKSKRKTRPSFANKDRKISSEKISEYKVSL